MWAHFKTKSNCPVVMFLFRLFGTLNPLYFSYKTYFRCKNSICNCTDREHALINTNKNEKALTTGKTKDGKPVISIG